MGLRSVLGLKSPEPIEASSNERALADISQQQAARYTGTFGGLQRELEDMGRKDMSATVRGRAAADVIQAMGTSKVGPGNIRRIGSASATGSKALQTAMTGGTTQARRLGDSRKMAAINFGMGNANASVEGMTTAAGAASQKARTALESDTNKWLSRVGVLGSVAGAGAAFALQPRAAPATSSTLAAHPNIARSYPGITPTHSLGAAPDPLNTAYNNFLSDI